MLNNMEKLLRGESGLKIDKTKNGRISLNIRLKNDSIQEYSTIYWIEYSTTGWIQLFG